MRRDEARGGGDQLAWYTKTAATGQKGGMSRTKSAGTQWTHLHRSGGACEEAEPEQQRGLSAPRRQKGPRVGAPWRRDVGAFSRSSSGSHASPTQTTRASVVRAASCTRARCDSAISLRTSAHVAPLPPAPPAPPDSARFGPSARLLAVGSISVAVTRE